jgi:micrococcal nuclease
MSNNPLVVKAVEVTDGDTIVVAGSSGDTVTVRVWGIDAPESGQPYGPAATRAARALVGGELADVHVKDKGPYGRYVGRVLVPYKDGKADLARSLALSGLAWHSRKYPTSDTLIQKEKEARAEGKGLWSQSDPVPPWTYRDRKGETGLLEAAYDGYKWGRWLWRLFS